jgi:hypothetical protein
LEWDDIRLIITEFAGSEMKIIAFINEQPVIREILGHLGEPTVPPPLIPARGLPLWELPNAEFVENDLQTHPASDFEFDQRVAW